MNYYLISYDLNGTNKDYSSLFDEIEKINTAPKCKPLESVWLIKSTLSAIDISKRIRSVVDKDDEFIILQISELNWSSESKKCKLRSTIFKDVKY